MHVPNYVIIKSDTFSYTLSEDIDWVNCHSHSGASRWIPRTNFAGLNIVCNFTTCENHNACLRIHVDMDDSVDDDDIIIMY